MNFYGYLLEKKNRSEETKPMVHVESMFAAPYYVGTRSIIVDCHVKYFQIHIHACVAVCNINSITRLL